MSIVSIMRFDTIEHTFTVRVKESFDLNTTMLNKAMFYSDGKSTSLQNLCDGSHL